MPLTTTYEIKTDAAAQTIDAVTRDEAVAIFAASEGLKGRDEATVRAEIEAMGGWLNVNEV
jgi:hypothetical protein